MVSPTTPETYSDEQLNEISRPIFVKALRAAEKLIDEGGSTERIHAVAAVADAAAGGFEPDKEDGGELFGS